jgi:nucleoside-diphosphate kinase
MENVGREISIWFPNGLITKPADPEERTLIFIKPDAYKRLKVGPENDKDLVGDLMKRFERKGLKVVAPKAVQPTREQAEGHYQEHKEKSFFEPLIEYTLSGEVYVAVLTGPNAVEATRKLMGSTNPDFALPGTVRGDFGIDVMHNAIHGSDSIENAEKEVKIWFSEWW